MQNADSNASPAVPERAGATIMPLPRAHQPDLLSAMRRARLEDAERTIVSAELRAAEIGRLEHLRVQLAPVFAQVGRDLVQFDHGLVASETPRLFIDMIAYVEMGHDRQTYRMVQDTRNGPVVLAQATAIDPIVAAVTDYVARRMVERERALAAVQLPVRVNPVAAAQVTPAESASTHSFGDVIAVYAAGAASGAALIYAATKLGWIG